jgi:hypothetical protein
LPPLYEVERGLGVSTNPLNEENQYLCNLTRFI